MCIVQVKNLDPTPDKVLRILHESVGVMTVNVGLRFVLIVVETCPK